MLFLSHKDYKIIHDYGNHMVTVVYEYFISVWFWKNNYSFKLNVPHIYCNVPHIYCNVYSLHHQENLYTSQTICATSITTPRLLCYTRAPLLDAIFTIIAQISHIVSKAQCSKWPWQKCQFKIIYATPNLMHVVLWLNFIENFKNIELEN